MFWYLIIIALMLMIVIFALIVEKKRINITKFTMLLAAIILMFFMCFRSADIGADTKQYTVAFVQICSFKLTELFGRSVLAASGRYSFVFENGYLLFNKIVGYISNKEQTIIIAVGAVIVVFVTIFCYKYSAYPLMSIWLYITLGIFQTNMNMSRNAVAIFGCYLSMHLILEKKLKEYLLCVVFATLFHRSAILFLPVYWLINNSELSYKTVKKLLLISIIIGFGFSFIRPLLIRILPGVFSRYLRRNTTEFEGLLVGAIHVLLVSAVMFFMRKPNRMQVFEYDRIGTWMLLLEIFFFVIGINVAYGARMAALFGPYIIILLPNLIYKGIESKNNKIALVLFIMMISGLQYILRLRINNIGGTMPYRFCW